jgi:hypothetical protein
MSAYAFLGGEKQGRNETRAGIENKFCGTKRRELM